MHVLIASFLTFAAVAALATAQASEPGVFWTVFAAVTGLCVGSFLNVVVYRLPVMLEQSTTRACKEHLGLVEEGAPAEVFNLSQPGSHCPHCQRPIRIVELVPVLSYLALRGKCAGCARHISARYPLVELACGLLGAMAVAVFGPSLMAAAACLFIWMSAAAALIDFDTFLLPDELTQPLLWGGLLLAATGIGIPLQEAVFGAAAGYGVLWGMNRAFRLLRGREGMGEGDFKYLAACGAFLGWKALALLVVVAGVTGLVAGVATLVRTARTGGSTAFPFGPHLAFAAVVLLLARPYAPLLGLAHLF